MLEGDFSLTLEMTSFSFKGGEERGRFAAGKSPPFLQVLNQQNVIPNGTQWNEGSPSVIQILRICQSCGNRDFIFNLGIKFI